MSSSVPFSIIQPDLVIRGSIETKGAVQVEGRIEGDVRAESAVVGDQGSIEGRVDADSLVVRGHASGNFRVRELKCTPSSEIEGEVVYERLLVSKGAKFKASCLHVTSGATHKSEPVPEYMAPVVPLFGEPQEEPAFDFDEVRAAR